MDFLTNIYTVEDRDKLLYEIELFKRQDFGNVRKNSLDFLKETSDLKSLQKKLTSFESVSLVLAIDPPMSVIESVLDTLQKSLGKQFILDISIDESILGGLIVIFKGKYEDLSVLKTLT